MLVDCVAIYGFIEVLGGLETRRFETETRQDFGVAKPKFFSVNIEEVDEKCMWNITMQTRDFGVSIQRRDTRLYITCFSLIQGCGVGSRSRMFSTEFGTEIVFSSMLKPQWLF